VMLVFRPSSCIMGCQVCWLGAYSTSRSQSVQCIISCGTTVSSSCSESVPHETSCCGMQLSWCAFEINKSSSFYSLLFTYVHVHQWCDHYGSLPWFDSWRWLRRCDVIKAHDWFCFPGDVDAEVWWICYLCSESPCFKDEMRWVALMWRLPWNVQSGESDVFLDVDDDTICFVVRLVCCDGCRNAGSH
jgi:hypothetical protein